MPFPFCFLNLLVTKRGVYRAVPILSNGTSNYISSYYSRMDQCGFDIGYKLLEVLYAKLRPGKRPTQVKEVLQFISSPCWKYLFGREADSLECRADNLNEFIITDLAPLCSKYISVPKVMVDLFAQL